jgi:hypothetical protein
MFRVPAATSKVDEERDETAQALCLEIDTPMEF